MGSEMFFRVECLLATALIFGSCASMEMRADMASGRLGSTTGDWPMIVAHRGASRDAPENTIPAFELAWRRGADAIEGDFRLTRGGEIVCIHDKDTKRVAGRKLFVAESTLPELRELDVGARRGEEFAGTTIPTIAEVFSTIPDGKKIYIEIKCGAEIIPPLLEEIARSGLAEEQIVVICFDRNVLREVKTEAPWSRTSWLCSVKRDKSGKLRPSLDEVLSVLEDINADGFSFGKDGVDRAFVEGIIAGGYEPHVWTVDKVETAARMKAWGALSITTNVPGHMRKHLTEQGEQQ